MTKRDDVIERNKWASHYAVLAGKEPLHTKPVPELKERKERAPSMEPSEYAIQKAVVGWWNLQCKVYGLPRFALFSCPNGSFLAGDATQAAIRNQRLQATGMRKGTPDLLLMVAKQGYHALAIELKNANGRISPDQHEFHHYLRSNGYWVEVPRSSEMAIAAITNYLRG